MMKSLHTWNFFRAGGFDQVRLDSGADLLALNELDQKLWVALSCPTRGIEFDSCTLDMIDSDGDGYVRANEILAAVNWIAPLVKNSDSLAGELDRLQLSNINDSNEQGAQILSAARHILKTVGKPEADEISLADLQGIEKFFAGLQLNGDGVLCAKQAEGADLQAVITDIEKAMGSVADVSGDQGVNETQVAQFFAEAAEYVAWHSKADAAVLLLGEESGGAAAAMQAVKAKIDDYFTRCQIAAYDSRTAGLLSRSTEDYQKLAIGNLSADNVEVAAFPLATIEANRSLSLMQGINPAWQQKIETFRTRAVLPLLGDKKNISATEWVALVEKFSAFEAWQSGKPASKIDVLGIVRLREILASDSQTELVRYFEQDKIAAAEIKEIRSVERLIRYQRDLLQLANNFVSFRDFYSGKKKAIFQVGTLYLDGRSCELCIRVEDVNAHAAFATPSGVCLAYCELVRNGGAEKMNIVAAFTAGDSDFLRAGRHGIFYNRKGQDWNATIVRIVDHPISIRQAFWLPYKKVSAAISEQMQKFAATKVSAGNDERVQAVNVVTNAVVASPSAPSKPAFDVAKFAGIFAAIGLAIGAIGGMVASIVGGIIGLKFWQIPFAFIGLMLAVSGPSMLLAWFKLKHRNLGPILDACGWAINARVLINVPFGTSLTALASLPTGAQRSLVDPYAEKKSWWHFTWIFVLFWGLMAWAWYVGFFSK
ncbi:MAG: hypothetical protein WCI39_07350 [Gallionellaceae bacterium]